MGGSRSSFERYVSLTDIENPSGLEVVFQIDGCDFVSSSGPRTKRLPGYLCTAVGAGAWVSVTGDYDEPELSYFPSGYDKPSWTRGIPVHHKIIAHDGAIYLLSFELRMYSGKKTKFDTIVKLSHSGEELWRWSTFDHLDEIDRMVGPLRAAFENKIEGGFYELTHINSFIVKNVPGGDEILFSLRDQSALLALRTQGNRLRLVRKFDEFEGLHSLQPHGDRILMFANKIPGKDGGVRSGVIDFDPRHGRIEKVISSFAGVSAFSATRGSVATRANDLVLSFRDGTVMVYSPGADKILYRARAMISGATKKPLEKIYEVSIAGDL